MGDFNAAVNETAKPFNPQARRILNWEESGDVRIMNDKQIPTHIPFKKDDAENCLNFIMITKGLETRTRNYKLDVDREWTPARAVPTGKGIGPGREYTRGQASDHKAQKVTLLLDIVEKGNEGNRAIINNNHREGWLLGCSVLLADAKNAHMKKANVYSYVKF